MGGRLAGKTALITAAGQGIGHATAVAFQKEGARVWATDIDEAKLAGLATLEGVTCRALDVRDAECRDGGGRGGRRRGRALQLRGPRAPRRDPRLRGARLGGDARTST